LILKIFIDLKIKNDIYQKVTKDLLDMI